MKNLSKQALKLHKKAKGKLEIKIKVPLKTKKNLSLAYTPGVAIPCLKIKENKEKVYDYTWKWNTVAVVTDGSAVLGLGNIGPYAALPVMEGKAILFKEFGQVDAIPICLETQKVEEIIDIVKKIAPTFGGINLEDISAPRCFTIERRLNEEIDIPVFHDDQDGTAIVVLAGLINALKLVNKKIENIKIVINGAGAAGIAITKMLYKVGARKIMLCDREGIIYRGRKENMNFAKEEVLNYLWEESKKGSLKDAMKESDVFIGVSGPNLVTEQMIKSMNKYPIVFAMSNPIPEIMPDKAKKAGAYIVATGRSDFPNQINNLLAFPGIFRGTFDAKAKKITERMKMSASLAIANYIPETKLSPSYIIPSALDKNVAKVVAGAVKRSANSID
ncbi:MAG: NADP-dependent malic enzyme [Candidatus Omnitrophica bacterium]|nr:NADP-dependent malic enzyme [Candidatus Omnitrophota bacterium]MCM8810184.1 NADP-dependent malic enzyme [Candidatus Omnitrophota bacterium]MCM8832641.1 NADP-dependent malic enzyme [Candidatus Omnitrophota bacterium]